MPIYSFQCPEGHIQEGLHPIGTERIACGCGLRAQRLSVFDPLVITTRAAVPRDQQRVSMKQFDEASEELAYQHRKAEEQAQKPLPYPNYWQAAQRRARLVRAGLAPPPSGRA